MKVSVSVQVRGTCLPHAYECALHHGVGAKSSVKAKKSVSLVIVSMYYVYLE